MKKGTILIPFIKILQITEFIFFYCKLRMPVIQRKDIF
jgi:hypothetical protein